MLTGNNYDMTLFYQRFVNARKRSGFKRDSDFARASAISPATISKWKKGTRPDIDSLVDICNLCNCDIDYLLGKLPPDIFKKENQHVVDSTQLSDAAIEKLREYKQKNSSVDLNLPWPVCVKETVDPLAWILDNDPSIEEQEAREHTIEAALIPALISHFLTYRESENEPTWFELLAKKMCLSGWDMLVYYSLPDTFMEICDKAYKRCESVSTEVLNREELMIKEYRKAADEMIANETESLLEECSGKTIDEIKSAIYGCFSIMHRTSERYTRPELYYYTQDLMRIIVKFGYIDGRDYRMFDFD